jgi:hypothetical protein
MNRKPRTTAEARRSRRNKLLSLLISGFAVAALVVGINIAAPPEVTHTQPAQAAALTYVQNTGSQPLTVVLNVGYQRRTLQPGQGVWGVNYIELGARDCIYGTINRCSNGYQGSTIGLGVGQYYERRTQF